MCSILPSIALLQIVSDKNFLSSIRAGFQFCPVDKLVSARPWIVTYYFASLPANKGMKLRPSGFALKSFGRFNAGLGIIVMELTTLASYFNIVRLGIYHNYIIIYSPYTRRFELAIACRFERWTVFLNADLCFKIRKKYLEEKVYQILS